jgi:hypothetical protein
MGWVGISEGVGEALLGDKLQAVKPSARIRISNPMRLMGSPLSDYPLSLRQDYAGFIFCQHRLQNANSECVEGPGKCLSSLGCGKCPVVHTPPSSVLIRIAQSRPAKPASVKISKIHLKINETGFSVAQ